MAENDTTQNDSEINLDDEQGGKAPKPKAKRAKKKTGGSKAKKKAKRTKKKARPQAKKKAAKKADTDTEISLDDETPPAPEDVREGKTYRQRREEQKAREEQGEDTEKPTEPEGAQLPKVTTEFPAWALVPIQEWWGSNEERVDPVIRGKIAEGLGALASLARPKP